MKRILSLLILLAPLPEGYAVHLSITRELGWPVWFAAPSAFVVAMIGFFSIQVAERMHSYNSTLRLDEKTAKMTAPIEQAFAALVIWFVGSTALILFLDSAWVATLAPVALAVIGASGSYIKSLSDGQDEREGERGKYREKLARKRDENKTQGGGKPGKLPKPKPQVARKHVASNDLAAYLQSNPSASQKQIANHFGVTRQAIGSRLKKQAMVENLFENVTK